METQTSLFGPATETIPTLPAKSRQQMMIEAMEAEKNRKCTEAFEPFILEYSRSHGEFIVADVVAEYTKAGLPAPAKDFRAVGGLVQRLVNKGELIRTGRKRELQDGTGRSMMIYRGK